MHENNSVLLHSEWNNVYEMSADDSYITFIRKIYEATDKFALLLEIINTPKK